MDVARDTAARLRDERRRVIADIASGAVALGSVPAAADPVKVVALVDVVPGVGKVRGRRVLGELDISPATRWGELPRPVVEALLERLQATVHDEQSGGEA